MNPMLEDAQPLMWDEPRQPMRYTPAPNPMLMAMQGVAQAAEMTRRPVMSALDKGAGVLTSALWPILRGDLHRAAANYVPGRQSDVDAELPRQAFDAAGNVMMGSAFAPAPRGALRLFGGQDEPNMLYSRGIPAAPKAVPKREFSFDYDSTLPAHGSPLKRTIDGTPIVAQHVVGRQTVGGDDVGLTGERLQSAAGGLVHRIGPASRTDLGRGVSGNYRRVATDTGPLREIAWRSDLDHSQASSVLQHELGHAIEDIVGNIPTKGLVKELETNYSTLLTGRTGGKLTKPQHVGYSKDEAPRELMAEAMRAYMADPNYFKTVAPKTAAAIRSYVNENHVVNKQIQFNASPFAGAVPLTFNEERR